MPAILLPGFPSPNGAQPRFLDSGGYQEPAFQGVTTRLDRLGDRWELPVSMPPMKWWRAGLARVWVNRLVLGRRFRVVMPFPQPGGQAPGHNFATAAAVAVTGSSVVVLNGTGSPTYLEGQFVSHLQVASGRRYLYQVAADANVGGVENGVQVNLSPRIRGKVSVGDVFEFANPKIEGFPQGDSTQWTLELARTVGLEFTVREAG